MIRQVDPRASLQETGNSITGGETRASHLPFELWNTALATPDIVRLPLITSRWPSSRR